MVFVNDKSLGRGRVHYSNCTHFLKEINFKCVEFTASGRTPVVNSVEQSEQGQWKTTELILQYVFCTEQKLCNLVYCFDECVRCS